MPLEFTSSEGIEANTKQTNIFGFRAICSSFPYRLLRGLTSNRGLPGQV